MTYRDTARELTNECGCREHKELMQPMAEMAREVNLMTGEALSQIEKIGRLLFGCDILSGEVRPEPGCFQDEVLMARNNLKDICEGLARISNRIWAD